MNFFRGIKRLPFAFLKIPFLRNRVIFELTHYYFDKLNFELPVPGGLRCPFSRRDAKWVFFEIFLQKDYALAFEAMPLPARWLDLGCNCGYFSLWLASLRLSRGLSPDFNTLLIDADSRAEQAVRKLIDINGFERQMIFKYGAVAQGQAASVFFSENENMWTSSLAAPGDEKGRRREVPVINAEQMLAIFPPPYDLIKLDIEGAEWDFLAGYRPVLDHAKYILMEYHPKKAGGRGLAEMKELAESARFSLVKDYTGPGGNKYLLFGKQNE